MSTSTLRAAKARRRGEELLLSHLTLPDAHGHMMWAGTTFEPSPGHVYGRQGGKTAHVRAYEHFVGPVPEGMVVDHLCRVTLCCAPDHLEPVTQAENIRRGLRGALFARCKNGHEMTPANTYRRKDNPGRRQCRRCKSDREHARRRRTAEKGMA